MTRRRGDPGADCARRVAATRGRAAGAVTKEAAAAAAGRLAPPRPEAVLPPGGSPAPGATRGRA
eukprot:1670203-Alexandrium_andersonii.AAC.1